MGNVVTVRAGKRAIEKELQTMAATTPALDAEDRELARMFAARGLRFEAATMDVVGKDRIIQEESARTFRKKRKRELRELIGPAVGLSLVFFGGSFGLIAAGYCWALAAGCAAWAISLVLR